MELTEEQAVIVRDRMQRDFDNLDSSKTSYPFGDYIINHAYALSEADDNLLAELIHEIANELSVGSFRYCDKEAKIAYEWVRKVAATRLKSAIDDCVLDGVISGEIK